MLNGDPSWIFCWWGTVSESMSERLVKIDCGTVYVGEKTYIQARNIGYSPDEHGVVSSTKCGKVRWIHTTWYLPPPSEVDRDIVLLEYKAQ